MIPVAGGTRGSAGTRMRPACASRAMVTVMPVSSQPATRRPGGPAARRPGGPAARQNTAHVNTIQF
jgi:hypothetical protein